VTWVFVFVLVRAGGKLVMGWLEWAVGWRKAGLREVVVGCIDYWAKSEVCCSCIQEYRRDFSCSNTGTVNTVGKQPPLFLFLYPPVSCFFPVFLFFLQKRDTVG
jgi:hypothetical protein